MGIRSGATTTAEQSNGGDGGVACHVCTCKQMSVHALMLSRAATGGQRTLHVHSTAAARATITTTTTTQYVHSAEHLDRSAERTFNSSVISLGYVTQVGR